jgi:hypothetical protein
MMNKKHREASTGIAVREIHENLDVMALDFDVVKPQNYGALWKRFQSFKDVRDKIPAVVEWRNVGFK